MTIPRFFALKALLVAALVAPVFAATPQHFQDDTALKTVRADPKAVADIDAVLQSFVDEHKLSGVVGFVAKDGDIVYKKAFGWNDVENKVPARVDDYYVLFSQTKAITTVAFMTLVEQGLVSIDDPVSKYFPEIPDRVVTKLNPDGTFESRPVASPMTFVHLMTHTSGLGAGLAHELRKIKTGIDDAPAGFGGPLPGETPAGQHTGGGNFKSRYLEEKMLTLAKYPLGFDPGTQWNYHVSTNMLGYLIERISGQPLRQYVKEKVLDPLGMTQTDWYYPRAALSRFVKGYHVAHGKLVAGPDIYSEGTVSTEQTYAEGALGLNGPIEDYAKFCQMLLNKGEFNGHRILRPETVELMTTINRLPAVASGENGFQFGLGFELYRQKKPVPAVSESAFAWGGMFGTAYIVDPEKRMIALFYTNTFQPEELYPKYLEKVYRAFAPPAAAAAPTADAPDAPASASTGHVTIVEDGGTGPYPAIATDDRTLPGMTIYRPADLAPFGKAQKLPILLWGNGACANTTQEHKNFLNEIASHGYLVLGIGLLDQIEHRDDTSRQPTNSSQLLAALEWILKQNTSPGSVYEGKVDASRIAAMGMSCGGLQAIEISGDPRITTTIVCNSGVLPAAPTLKGMPLVPKDALKKFHGPVLYIMGGPTDIAYNNAMDDFSRVDHVPIVMTNFDVGHGGTYGRPHGGEFTPVALAWLDWQLKGSAKGPGMFLGENSELRRDPKWKVETKNFGARK